MLNIIWVLFYKYSTLQRVRKEGSPSRISPQIASRAFKDKYAEMKFAHKKPFFVGLADALSLDLLVTGMWLLRF